MTRKVTTKLAHKLAHNHRVAGGGGGGVVEGGCRCENIGVGGCRCENIGVGGKTLM